MRRNTAVFVALGVAAAVALMAGVTLGLGLLLSGRHGSAKPPGAPVWDRDPASAVALDAIAPGGPLHLSRAGAGWQGAGPVPAERVAPLLSALGALRVREQLAGPGKADLAWYGLDHPRLRISVTLADGAVQSLALGQASGQDGTVFALGSRGEVLVLRADDAAAVESHLGALQTHPPNGGPTRPNGG